MTAKLTTTDIETLFRAKLPGARIETRSGLVNGRAVTLLVAECRGKRAEATLRSGHSRDLESQAHELKVALGL